MANGSSDWMRTMFGALSAIAVTVAGMYTVVIVPQNLRIEKLENGREDDRKTLTTLFLSIRENDQYKIFAKSERDGLRRDLDKADSHLLRVEDEQKRRTSSVTSIGALEKRIDRLDQRAEENEKRLAAGYTLNDVIKRLSEDLADLRRRIMVPATVIQKE